MRKGIRKDKFMRTRVFMNEKSKLISKFIKRNMMFVNTIRRSVGTHLFEYTFSSSSLISRCIITGSKKKWSKIINFSRVFLAHWIRTYFERTKTNDFFKSKW